MKKLEILKSTFIKLLILCILITAFSCFFINVKIKINPAENPYQFADILSSKIQPENGKNVFFIESGNSIDDVALNSRQACAIESAALTNPHLKVFVLYTSRERLEGLKISRELDAILSYPNVFINYLSIDELSLSSPMENFIASKKLEESEFRVEHTSDVLRLLLLWKFGGTYLDMDTIDRKKLDSVQSNYACPESRVYMNGAILNFDNEGGKDLAEIFIKAMVQNFDGASRGQNGPILISDVLEKLCNASTTSEMVMKGNCNGFHVLPRKMCYPVDGYHWRRLMDEVYSNETMAKVEESLVVHFWNHNTKNVKLLRNSTAAYIRLANQFCPKVMQSCEEYF